jgi:hypothetical protein
MNMKKAFFTMLAVVGLLAVGCASLGNLFLTDQQKQWKAEGRNIQTGLFDEPYSGKTFQEKTELEAFKATAEYNEAVANYNAWRSTYDREQKRIDEVQRRNQAAWNDVQLRAQRWVAETKQDGLRSRHFSANALFEEKYEPNLDFTQLVAILRVDNQEYARNVFTCQREPASKNQVGEYNPRTKY